jgi:hypothetical protein
MPSSRLAEQSRDRAAGADGESFRPTLPTIRLLCGRHEPRVWVTCHRSAKAPARPTPDDSMATSLTSVSVDQRNVFARRTLRFIRAALASMRSTIFRFHRQPCPASKSNHDSGKLALLQSTRFRLAIIGRWIAEFPLSFVDLRTKTSSSPSRHQSIKRQRRPVAML